MPRTYPERRRRLTLGMGRRTAMLAAAAGLSAVGIPLAAANLFDSQTLDEQRFAVLAQPVGRDRWKLLVLEQIQARPLCWEERSDGLVNPSLNGFDFSGICSRYLDSNGYSLRTGGSDMERSFRLRVENNRYGLALTAMDPNRGEPIVVARASRVARDRNAFVKLTLEPGWSLERRAYKGRTLSHVYFANPEPTQALLAKAGSRPISVGEQFNDLPLRAPVPPADLRLASRSSGVHGEGPIRLEVIPFQP